MLVDLHACELTVDLCYVRGIVEAVAAILLPSSLQCHKLPVDEQTASFPRRIKRLGDLMTVNAQTVE